MNDSASMEPLPPDLERIFAHRGGFLAAMAKLTAYAIYVIQTRQGPSKNGRAVARLDAPQLVRNALSRLPEMKSLEDGENVYFQLRRHIDNEVHTLQKKKTPDPRYVAIASGTPQEGSPEVAEPEDVTVTDVADGVEQKAEDEFYRDLLSEVQRQYKPTTPEFRLINFVLDGGGERPEIAKKLGITPATYDAVLKKVSRAARELRDTKLMRTK